MAKLHPLRGLRFDPERVELHRVLAPPYDVISDRLQDELYARDPHNIVRVDYGKELPHDTAGVDDRYVRAAQYLREWLEQGILRRDAAPALYVSEHGFATEDGRKLVRTGLFARVAARPWERSEVLPHERTLRGPKEDRLALLRATATQTSAVFVLWDGAPGIDELLASITGGKPDVSGHHRGEVDDEAHRLWVVDDATQRDALLERLAPARLYMADGHHRFETAAACAAARRATEPDAPEDADFALTLIYLCDAAAEAVEVLPTHRLVLHAPGVPVALAEFLARLNHRFAAERHDSLAAAVGGAAALRSSRHAFAIGMADGAALIHAAPSGGGSPRQRLDVVVLEESVLGPACGIDAERIAAGALAYTRSVAEAQARVASGEVALAACVNACSTTEIIAVSNAGETMPQKSSYFYPKVPTGLVLSPS